MFSGIVEELGEVKKISRKGFTTFIEIKAKEILGDIKTGDSISLNGACVTVVAKDNSHIVFEVIPETLKVTNLGLLRVSDKVNLERSLKVGDRISGHFVSGHVDCLGIIRKRYLSKSNLTFVITFPVQFLKYIWSKGSIAVDGISLTVADIRSNTFSVYIIPHTAKFTTLGFKGPSDQVNLEFDLLAKKSA